MNSKFYKSEADRLLAVNDRRKNFAMIALIATLATMLTSFIFAPVGSLVLTPIISLGYTYVSFKVYRDEDIEIKDIYSNTSSSRFVDAILYNLLSVVVTTLGIMLFIIPGIYIALGLSMCYFIMADDAQISFIDAMKKSFEMMKGRRWDFVKLQLSFFGWYLLSVVTFGLAMIWAMPRIQTANAVFYATLKKELYGEDITGKAAGTEANSPFENVFNGNDAAERPQYYNLETPYSQPAYEPQQTAYTPAADVAPAPAAEAETFEAPAYNVPEVTDVTNTDNLN